VPLKPTFVGLSIELLLSRVFQIEMKITSLYITMLVVFAFILTGCEAIGTIFNAGVYTGIFIVVLVIGLILFLVVRLGKRD
jgi:hypothetical protein